MQQKKRFSIKKAVRTLHLWLGLGSGIIVVIVGLTAAALVFEEEGRELFQHRYYHVPVPASAERMPFTQLVDSFKTRYPKEKIASIRFKESPDAAFVFFTKTRFISMDPYTARVTGVRTVTGDFFTVVQKIHTELLLGPPGKKIIGINVLIFFVMCISGLVLWWPKQKNFLKSAIRINFKTKNRKRLNWDLHSVLGFYALLVLLIISLTGLFFAFDAAKSFAALITGSKLPAKEEKIRLRSPKQDQHGPMHGRPAADSSAVFTLDSAYRYCLVHYPGAKETFLTPADSGNPVRVLMRYPYTIVRRQNTIYFSPTNGRILKADLYTAYSGYDRIARSNYDFHTGKIRALGIGSKIIYFLVALIAASLPITGTLIWLGRRKKSPAKIHRPAFSGTTASPQSAQPGV